MEYEDILDMPVVKEVLCSYLICDIVNAIDCDSHDLFIGQAIETKK